MKKIPKKVSHQIAFQVAKMNGGLEKKFFENITFKTPEISTSKTSFTF